MPRLRDGSTATDPRLDRLVEFDEQSRQYGVCELLPASPQPATKLWTFPASTPVLDQGREGACPGYGVTNELRCNPVPIRGLDDVFARETIYWQAQRDDQWPGGDYPGASPRYEGTSVLAAVKVATKLGYYGEYRWGFGEADAAVAISLGPLILGLPWWTGMFAPDRSGFLRRTGKVEGGHCLIAIGINVSGAGYYTIYNSWGPKWGKNGTAKISRTDMAALLADNGEVCVITQRLTPAAAR